MNVDNQRAQIKICGVRDAEIARLAEELGAAYVGLIFAEKSPRRVTEAEARAIAESLTGRARCVGVFVSHPVAEIRRLAAAIPLHVVQLHGRYAPDDIAALHHYGLEVWRLLAPDEPVDVARDASAVLLDGSVAGQTGGTGTRADWSRVAPLKAAGFRVVLAGGISAANAPAALATGCDVLDVNSSLESPPAVKSAPLLAAFFAAIRTGAES